MKFDVFSPSTWGLDSSSKTSCTCACNAKKSINRAMGNVGQFMHYVNDLEDQLKKSATENAEFVTASNLQTSNPEAFKEFNISFVYPDAACASLLQTIHLIKSLWADRDNRERNLNQILISAQSLKQYLESPHYSRSSYFVNKEMVSSIQQIKVLGNSAWKLFWLDRNSSDYWHKRFNEVSTKLAQYDDDSDSDDDS